MKKNIFTFILFLVFVANAYSVNLSYIPTDTSFVWSIKLDSITSKSEISTQEFLNLIFIDELAIRFDDARDDENVSYAMRNSITSMLDFKKTSRLINTGKTFSLLIDISDIKEFDLFMLKMARAEVFTIEPVYEGKFRYLELDEETIFAWDNNVVSIIVLSDDAENVNLLDIANQIFSREGNISDETFLALEKDTKWASAFWLDYEMLASEYNLWQMMDIDDYPKLKAKVEKEYKDAILTAKAFIKNYEIEVEIETYTPNATMDATTLIKQIDKNIYNLVPDNNIGFISFSVNIQELGKMIFEFIKDTEFEEEVNSYLDELGGSVAVFNVINMLSGDFIISTSGLDNGQDFFAVIGVNNEEDAVKFVKDLYESKSDGEELTETINNGFTVFDIDGMYLAFKDNLVYIAADETALSYIMNEINNDSLSSAKSKIINDNMFSMFLNVDVLNALVGSESLDDFTSFTMTSKVLSKTNSEITFKLNSKDKNILKSLLYLIDEF